MGKGSNIRPRFIPHSEWKENFERIFGHDEDFEGTDPEQVGQSPVTEGEDNESERIR